jgi:hypothetical protein
LPGGKRGYKTLVVKKLYFVHGKWLSVGKENPSEPLLRGCGYSENGLEYGFYGFGIICHSRR